MKYKKYIICSGEEISRILNNCDLGTDAGISYNGYGEIFFEAIDVFKGEPFDIIDKNVIYDVLSDYLSSYYNESINIVNISYNTCETGKFAIEVE